MTTADRTPVLIPKSARTPPWSRHEHVLGCGDRSVERQFARVDRYLVGLVRVERHDGLAARIGDGDRAVFAIDLDARRARIDDGEGVIDAVGEGDRASGGDYGALNPDRSGEASIRLKSRRVDFPVIAAVGDARLAERGPRPPDPISATQNFPAVRRGAC